MKTDILSVIYSSDNNYAQHMGVSIYSLLEHNQEFAKVQIYIIENQISKDNKEKLQKVIENFEKGELIWIDFTKWKQHLSLKMEWKLSVSAYARLFISSMIPKTVKRILYLDCDMVICDSLKELWNSDLKDNIIGAVQDPVNDETKAAVGVAARQRYFNSGMLLINVEEWQRNEIEKLALKFISEHHGQVKHHDQGVLNGILNERWMLLPLRYNLMTIHFMYSDSKIMKYFQNHADYYSTGEIEMSKENPAIIHYTPSFTTRPWVQNCKHPLKGLYWNTLKKTPWSDAKEEKDNRKLHVRLVEWRYRCLPF